MKACWQELRNCRPRRPFVTRSLQLFALIMVFSWLAGDFHLAEWFSDRRLDNLDRFLGEVRPWPLQGKNWETSVAWHWAVGLWRDGGGAALLATFALSLAAITGAGLLGALFSLPAARTFARPQPFLPGGRPAGKPVVWMWAFLVLATRAMLVFLRSVPEYVWAFLLLALLGPQFWPLVLALILHNAGILGKLGSEVVENTADHAPSALRALGAGRLQIVLGALFPLILPRFLLYFFYRWETCIREATVLGMLGVSSLGFLIVDARARNHYDELLYFIMLGVLLVWAGDLVSALVRRLVRSA